MKERLIQSEAEAFRIRRAIANNFVGCSPGLTSTNNKPCVDHPRGGHDYLCVRLFPKITGGPDWCPCACYNRKYITVKIRKALDEWEDSL